MHWSRSSSVDRVNKLLCGIVYMQHVTSVSGDFSISHLKMTSDMYKVKKIACRGWGTAVEYGDSVTFFLLCCHLFNFLGQQLQLLYFKDSQRSLCICCSQARASNTNLKKGQPPRHWWNYMIFALLVIQPGIDGRTRAIKQQGLKEQSPLGPCRLNRAPLILAMSFKGVFMKCFLFFLSFDRSQLSSSCAQYIVQKYYNWVPRDVEGLSSQRFNECSLHLRLGQVNCKNNNWVHRRLKYWSVSRRTQVTVITR